MSEDNFIYETNHWKVVLAADQTYVGRCVVVLKRKCGDLADITHEEILDFLDGVITRFESAMRAEFGARMFNWSCLMNDAYQEENPDPQVHWHVRPRYDQPVAINSETFIDLEFGHHYNRTAKRMVEKDMQIAIIKKIQKAI